MIQNIYNDHMSAVIEGVLFGLQRHYDWFKLKLMFTNDKVRIGALVAIVALCTAKSCKQNKKYLGEFEKRTSKSPDGKGVSNFTKKLNSISHLTPNASHSDDPKHSEGKGDGEHPSDAVENALTQSGISYRSGGKVSSTPSKSRLEDDEEHPERELIETSSSTDDYTFDRDCTFNYKQEVPELAGVIEAITEHGECNFITRRCNVPCTLLRHNIFSIRGIYICKVLDNERTIRVFVLKFDGGNIFHKMYELVTFKINASQTITQAGYAKSSLSRDVKSVIDSRNHRLLHDIIKEDLSIKNPNNAKITLEYESNFFGS